MTHTMLYFLRHKAHSDDILKRFGTFWYHAIGPKAHGDKFFNENIVVSLLLIDYLGDVEIKRES